MQLMHSQPKLNSHILILDGDEFSTLSIVRSLGRKGLSITVAAATKSAICKHSKYIQHFFTYPDPLSDIEGFNQAIVNHIQNRQYDLLIPVTELTTLPLSKIRSVIEKHTTLALSNESSLEKVTDKSQTFDLAIKVGVPVPKSYYIKSQQSLDNYIEALEYPIVLKPTRSIIDPTDDLRAKLNVDYAFNPDQLQKKVCSLLKVSEIILQEYFTGTGTGIELIADNGEIIHAFQHDRIHELPLTGGGSCLRKSVPINPQLLEYSQKLIKELNWHGVAMVEFKHNNLTNKSCLMEINGRFWGSLPLAVSSGSDFPWYLYQLIVHKQHPERFNSEIGHISRKIKDDLYWYIQVIFRRDKNPLIKWPKYSKLFIDLISIFHYKHHFDAFHYQDLKPGLVELQRTSKWLLTFTSDFIVKKHLFKKHLKIKQQQSIYKALNKTNNILFLCYGNINRSAAAECIYTQQGKTEFTVQSAGFHLKSQRPADPNMVKEAVEHDIAMQNCSSQTLNLDMLNKADIIFAMEIEHLLKLKELYPAHSHKAYLLGSLSPKLESPLEISDPYGKSPEDYQQCFKQIQHCINYIGKGVN